MQNEIDCEQCHPILAVDDLPAAIEFYTTKLGFWLAFAEEDPPRFAGLNLGRVQLFLERGEPGPNGCAVYFVVGDADELHRRHELAGVPMLEPLGDREYHLRDYTVRDPWGYRLTFGHRLHPLESRLPEKGA